jgi:histidyl-tRNA synthetase
MINPRTLKGFRDFLPEAMIPREQLIDTARRVYRSFGYSPIDTPVLELLVFQSFAYSTCHNESSSQYGR